jgi:hypothetical protein
MRTASADPGWRTMLVPVMPSIPEQVLDRARQRDRAKHRENSHQLDSIRLDDPDWRPSDHAFTDAEMRDRFMRYGGVDAATAWALVWFIRDRIPDIDLVAVFVASGLGFVMPSEFGLAL